MAVDEKLSSRPSLTTPPESADFFHIVDVSDTTDSPQGSSKQITFDTFSPMSPFFFDLTSPPDSLKILVSTELGNAFGFEYSSIDEQFSLANTNGGGGNSYNLSFVNKITIGGISKIVAAPTAAFLEAVPATVFYFSDDGLLDANLDNAANNSLTELFFTSINVGTDQRLYVQANVLKTSTGRTIWGWTKQA